MAKLPFTINPQPAREIDRYSERLRQVTSKRPPQQKVEELAKAYSASPAKVLPFGRRGK